MADAISKNIAKYSVQLGKAFQTVKNACPERMNSIFDGYSTNKYGYSGDKIADREALCDILAGMEKNLADIKTIFSEWERGRMDTIKKLRIFADELDRKNTNKGNLAGFVFGVLSSVLGLASAVFSASAKWLTSQLSGNSMSVVAGVIFVDNMNHFRSQVKQFMKSEQELTGRLTEKLEDLDEYIGRLGRWNDSSCTYDTTVETLRTLVPQAAGFLTEYCVNNSKAITQYISNTGLGEAAELGDGEKKTVVEHVAHVGHVVKETGMTCLNILAVAIDVTMIGFVFNDLFQKRSKTATGEQVRDAASKLENELKEMRKIYDKIKDDNKISDLKNEIAKQNEEVDRQNGEMEKLKQWLLFLFLCFILCLGVSCFVFLFELSTRRIFR